MSVDFERTTDPISPSFTLSLLIVVASNQRNDDMKHKRNCQRILDIREHSSTYLYRSLGVLTINSTKPQKSP